jgi:putative peptidoglycan lipid II flippase
MLLVRVALASALLGAALFWLTNNLPWLDWPVKPYGAWLRLGSLFGIIVASGAVYFAILALSGLKLKALIKHSDK